MNENGTKNEMFSINMSFEATNIKSVKQHHVHEQKSNHYPKEMYREVFHLPEVDSKFFWNIEYGFLGVVKSKERQNCQGRF